MKSAKRILLFAILLAIAVWTILLSSCVQTALFEDGKPVAVFGSDITNLHYKSARTEFSAERLDNSTPAATYVHAVDAYGNVIAKTILSTSGGAYLSRQ